MLVVQGLYMCEIERDEITQKYGEKANRGTLEVSIETGIIL